MKKMKPPRRDVIARQFFAGSGVLLLAAGIHPHAIPGFDARVRYVEDAIRKGLRRGK